jgi:hypothetical protein
MIQTAVDDCANGHNVYLEALTVRADLTGRKRGSLADTRGVFALVVDSDGDMDKAWTPETIIPSMTVTTSPGNFQYWYFLEIAVDGETGKDLGKRIKHATRTDSDTGVVTQPYRVAGTTNYPNAAKIARGRFVVPTRLIDCQPDRVYSVEALEAVFPPLTSPKKKSAESKTNSGNGAVHAGEYVQGDMPSELLDLVRHGVPDSEDRSKVFHSVIGKLKRGGWSLDAIVELLQEYPDGIARKYSGRIRYAAELSYGKIEIIEPAPSPPCVEPVVFTPTPFVLGDPSKFPRRKFLYGHHYIRGYVSSTVSAYDVGKTALALADAVSMAANKPLLDVRFKGPLRVWYWGEDPLEEIDRRITAICKHHSKQHNIDNAALNNNLLRSSFRDKNQKLIIATMERRDGFKIAIPVKDALTKALIDNHIDVLIIDPFIKAHRIPENDNTLMDAVVSTFNEIAEDANCSIELVQHARKTNKTNGNDITIEMPAAPAPSSAPPVPGASSTA